MAPSSRGHCHRLQSPPGVAGSAKDCWHHAAWSTPAGNVYRADHVALAPPPAQRPHTQSPDVHGDIAGVPSGAAPNGNSQRLPTAERKEVRGLARERTVPQTGRTGPCPSQCHGGLPGHTTLLRPRHATLPAGGTDLRT